MVEFPRDEESKLILAYRSMMGMDLRGIGKIKNMVINNWIELLAHQLEERGCVLEINCSRDFPSFSGNPSFPYRILVYACGDVDIIRYERDSNGTQRDVEHFNFVHVPVGPGINDDEINEVRRKLLDMVLRHELNSNNWHQLPHWMGDVDGNYYAVAAVFREDFPR